jgi:D-lactate dehydrogenase
METPPEVIFYEAFAEEEACLRRHLPADLPARFTWRTVQEAGDRLPPAPVVSVRTQSVTPTDWATSLRAMLTRSTGYDHLTAYRTTAGGSLQYGYLPLYCSRAVAEQAMLLWMALLRRLPRQVRQFAGFHRDGLTGGECRGRTLLVVGVGNIGHEVVDIGRALGMNVFAVDPRQRWQDVAYVSYEQAAPVADVVVAAMDLNPSSRGYFGAERIARMKRGAVFVNVARGELSEAAALLAALDAGRLAGIGLDVYDHEPELAVALRAGQARGDAAAAVKAVLDLARRDDVVCTPHNAFNTAESVERKAEQSAQQLEHLRRTGRFLWPVP